MNDAKNITDRITRAVMAIAPGERGHVLRKASDSLAALSFSDLMTDLGPFIMAEIARAYDDGTKIGTADEREACAQIIADAADHPAIGVSAEEVDRLLALEEKIRTRSNP